MMGKAKVRKMSEEKSKLVFWYCSRKAKPSVEGYQLNLGVWSLPINSSPRFSSTPLSPRENLTSSREEKEEKRTSAALVLVKMLK